MVGVRGGWGLGVVGGLGGGACQGSWRSRHGGGLGVVGSGVVGVRGGWGLG